MKLLGDLSCQAIQVAPELIEPVARPALEASSLLAHLLGLPEDRTKGLNYRKEWNIR